MRISAIWSLFANKNESEKFFINKSFDYSIGFQTIDFKIENKYYKLIDNQKVLIAKDSIPQATFSAMLQSEDWIEYAPK